MARWTFPSFISWKCFLTNYWEIFLTLGLRHETVNFLQLQYSIYLGRNLSWSSVSSEGEFCAIFFVFVFLNFDCGTEHIKHHDILVYADCLSVAEDVSAVKLESVLCDLVAELAPPAVAFCCFLRNKSHRPNRDSRSKEQLSFYWIRVRCQKLNLRLLALDRRRN